VRGASRVLARRLFRAVATLVALTAVTYFMIEFSIEGGVAAVVLGACPRDSIAGFCGEIVERYRLDDPVPLRYLKWLGDALQGDLNRSSVTDQPVLSTILDKAPITTELALVAILLAVIVAVPLGVYSAYRDDTTQGRAVSSMVQTMQSIPVFVSGLFLIWLMGEKLMLLPSSGWVRISDSVAGNLKTLILPATTLALAEIGVFARVIRADLIATFDEEFVTAAKSKGLGTTYMMFRHVLRPSSLGLLTVIGLNVSALLGGAVVVEIVFGIGGIGPKLFEAILNRDIYLIQGFTLYIGGIFVAVNMLVDYLYGLVDPRLRDSLAR